MYYLGVDIGGSKIAVSLADEDCRILDTLFMETPSSIDFCLVRDATFACIRELLDRRSVGREAIKAIGISCPGPLDLREGKIIYVATTGWRDIPLVRMFKEEFSTEVVLENDANAAAYAETALGAGRGASIVAYITVSTGIGGGVCVDGEIYRGSHGYAGEFGHICVEPQGEPCSCGSRGCLQLYSSGTAIAARARALAAKEVVDAVRAGDPNATAVWDEAMRKLGFAIASINMVLDPEVFVLGGGVSNAWDLMRDRVLEAARERSYSATRDSIVIRKAELGALIGTTGALLLARKSR